MNSIPSLLIEKKSTMKLGLTVAEAKKLIKGIPEKFVRFFKMIRSDIRGDWVIFYSSSKNHTLRVWSEIFGYALKWPYVNPMLSCPHNYNRGETYEPI